MVESHRKGRESEAFFYYLAQRLGWELALPACVAEAYDFAVRFPDTKKWKKLQIKTSAVKRAGRPPSVDIRKVHSNSYLPTDFDYLGIYDPSTLRAWLIPHSKLRGRTCELTPTMVEWSKYEVTYKTNERKSNETTNYPLRVIKSNSLRG